MKVIAVKRKSYICEVMHDELEMFLNLYYNKLPALKDGDEIDLGKGYDFLGDAKSAIKKTQDFIEGNKKIIETIMAGIKILNINPQTETEKDHG